ncbi:hypothetical protein ACFE04_022946 [Oxalis oulophora]
MALDLLHCEEELLDITEEVNFEFDLKDSFLLSSIEDLNWDNNNNKLEGLIAKQETQLCFNDKISDGFLFNVRKEAVDWILRVKAHYGFRVLTVVLALNYFDRFSSLGFKFVKPWMGQLVAVACLSLAAKVEETHVPLLLDLQVEESRFVFEAKTIQRMELLVLSSLNWKMHPVTPISFIDHVIRRLRLRTRSHLEFLQSCERLMLSVFYDLKIMCYPPSVLATAIMLQVIKEFEPCNQMEYQNQLVDLLKVSRDEVVTCFNLLQELLADNGSHNQKRKRVSVPSSPNCVIDTTFSCDSSNDSWAFTPTPSVSSSPEPLFKRSKPQAQQTTMPSLNQVFVNVPRSPR